MKHLLALGLAFSSFSVFAGGDLTFEQFKQSCADENYQGQQRPPQKIRILCKNAMTSWQAIESAPLKLMESRSITTELFSDKYHVGSADYALTTPERVAACPRFREVVATVTLESALTCDQVKDETRDLRDICLAVIDEQIAANPDLVEVTPTGKLLNTCGDGTIIQKP